MKKYARILRFDLFYLYGFGSLLLCIAFYKAIFYLFLIIYIICIRKIINIKFLLLILFIIYILINKTYDNYLNNFGIVIEKDNYLTIYIKGHLYHLYGYDLNVGDIVNIDASIYKYQNIFFGNSYNPFMSYASKNIMGELKINHIEIIGNLPIFNIREKLIKYIKSFEITNNYISLIILDKKVSNHTITNIYNSLDIYHLIGLSGFVINLLLLFIKKILFYFNASNNVYRFITYGLLLWFIYLQLGSFVILKIIIFKLLKELNYHKKIGLDILNIWHITYLIIFIMKPYLIYSKGYLISFIMVNVISLTNIKISNYFFRRIVLGLTVSIIMIPFFGKTNFLNILLTPIYLYFIGFGYFIFSILTLIMPFMNNFFVEYIALFEKILMNLEHVNISLYIPKIKTIYIIFWYVLIYFFFINKSIFKKFICLVSLLMIVFIPSLKYQISDQLDVYFLNVGQGDASVVIYKDLVVVIDCFQYVEDFLRDKGIKKIDYLILTHSDIDHMKEADNLINHMEVDKLVLSRYENYGLKHDNIYFPMPLDVIKYNELSLMFLGPLKAYNTNNDQSLVIKLNIYNKTVLFPGDIEKEAEDDLVSKYRHILKSDILKVSHHGSKTSSSEAFIKYVRPKHAVFSYHINNKFDMPNKDVISRIMAYSKDLYHTAIDGTIHCKIDRSNIKCNNHYH